MAVRRVIASVLQKAEKIQFYQDIGCLSLSFVDFSFRWRFFFQSKCSFVCFVCFKIEYLLGTK